MTVHETYMMRCLDLARAGLRDAMPNPSVGAVVVHNGRIIGEGATSPYGGPHAEVNAINSVEDQSLLANSSIYVSLEPCSHFGKTPPCSDLIISSGIREVFIGIKDPFKAVNGSGIQKLEQSGIKVVVGILSNECYSLNKRFFTFHEKKRPYILLKWAQSEDGFMDKKRNPNDVGVNWITAPGTRQLTHQWRTEEMAIAVGTTTAIIDNPTLTAREASGKNPTRIVLDKSDKLDKNSNLFKGNTPTIVLTEYDSSQENQIEKIQINFDDVPNEICRVLYERQLQSVIIEGGNQLITSFIKAGLWDEARILTGAVQFEAGLSAPRLKNKPDKTFTFGPDQIAIHYA